MVYDTRKEVDLIKLEKQASTGMLKKKEALGEKNLAPQSNQGMKTKPWGDLWKRKKQNNIDYLLEAETGNL